MLPYVSSLGTGLDGLASCIFSSFHSDIDMDITGHRILPPPWSGTGNVYSNKIVPLG